MENPVYNFKWNSIKRFEQLCSEEYEKGWLAKLKEFEKCESKERNWYGKFKKLVKRWIVWFIAAVVVILVVSAITATTVMMNTKVNTMNESLTQAHERIEQITSAFHQQTDINNRTIKAVEDLLVKTDRMIGALHEFSNVVPELLWSGNKIYKRLEGSKEAFQSLTNACKVGQVDPVGLGYILNYPDLKTIRKEDTQLESISRINNNTLQIRFTSPSPIEDTKIYKIMAFKYWVNLTTHPEQVKYMGPKYLVHNYTSNCTHGIQEPETNAVYERCLLQDHGDQELMRWGTLKIENQTTEPQIMKTRLHSYIYCMFHNITIDGETHQCPPFVFKLPILQSFGIGNLTHTVNILKLNSTVEVESLRIKHLNSSIHDDFENQLALIYSIRNLNKQLGNTIKERNESIVIPWNSITFWSWNMVSVASLILGIICCILKLGGKGGENHSEYITVVNRTPPAIGLKSLYPNLKKNPEEKHYEEIEERETFN